MSRICLVGIGDPSFRPSLVHAGPGLRLTHVATALVRDRHELFVVVVHNGSSNSHAPVTPRAGSASIEGHSIRTLDVAESALADAACLSRVRSFRPDAIVGVTTLGASLACRLGLDVPLWADVFGDFMAEAQAKALVQQSDAGIARFWATFQPVLHIADRFSAVSQAQADALIGQLGLAGRLTHKNAGAPLVSVIPCAAEEPRARSGVVASVDGIDEDAFVVLWSGSFNTWCDVDTLFTGVERAMERLPTLVFLSTGGEVKGHDEVTYAHFRALVDASPQRERFRLLGWVDPQIAAQCTRRADLGIIVERDLYERRFGSENRVVHWMAQGLPCVTTALSELGRALRARDLAFAVPTRDPEALAGALVDAASDPERLRAMGEACAAWCDEHFAYDLTAQTLVEWCRAPIRAADQGYPRVVTLGSLTEPRAMVQLLEAYLNELGLEQVAYRSVRWLWRRLAGRIALRRAVHRANCVTPPRKGGIRRPPSSPAELSDTSVCD